MPIIYPASAGGGGTVERYQESFPFPYGATPTLGVPNVAYYNSFLVPIGFTATKVYIWIHAVGGTPTDVDLGLYNSAGTKIGGVASPVTVAATGLMTFTLSSSVTFSSRTLYWIGFAGTSGSNSQMLGDNANSANDTTYNRTANTTTVGASLPAGSSTATKIWSLIGE